jgi:16S rRNA (uracil1498-N3)-methyltransferase
VRPDLYAAVSLHRFFVPRDAFSGDEVHLEGELAHRISRVLRLQPGDAVVLLDGGDLEYEIRLEKVGPRSVTGTVVGRRPGQPERSVRLVLYQSLVKGERFDWVLEKGTELGVAAFAPLVSRRNVRQPMPERSGRPERWRRVVREAAEQCGRSVLPDLLPAQSLAKALSGAADLRLLPWEDEEALGLATALRDGRPTLEAVERPTVAVFIGPEGGFTVEEVALAREAGAQVVSLGRHILRSETAGIVAVAAVLYEMGELGG